MQRLTEANLHDLFDLDFVKSEPRLLYRDTAKEAFEIIGLFSLINTS
jgi:hypothetical protein